MQQICDPATRAGLESEGCCLPHFPERLGAINPVKGMEQSEIKLLALLGAGAFVLASTYTSINVALPDIQEEFDISLSALKWVSIIGAIMVASLSLCFGRVGDLLGRRRIYKLGIIVYTLGAGLTATSLSFPELMGFRVLMATGLAASNPLAGAIIAASVAPHRRGQAVGLFASFQAAGMLTGPTFGGILLDLFNWRAIFISYLCIGSVLALAQHFLLRGDEERRREAFDYLGALLLLIGYPSLLIGLSLGPGEGWGAPLTLFWFAVGAIGLISFGVRELHFDKPIFHFRFFRNATFCIAMFILVASSFVQNPLTLFSPLYLEKVLDLDGFTVGLVMMALPISTLIAGPIGGKLADRGDPLMIAGFGASITLCAVFIYSRLGIDGPLLFAAVALVLVGFGAGFFRPATQVAVYADADRSDYGALTAMLVLIQSLAGTLGTTIVAAISESRASADDAVAFTEGQQLAFTLLIPLLATAVVVAFLSPLRRRLSRPQPALAKEQV
jgi:EmrB/QacA subfamily drug resistance transporter